MQAFGSISKKIVELTKGVGPRAKNWMQRLQLKKWSQWVSGNAPMPDKPQRMALASTAVVALVVVVLLVVGAGTVLKNPSPHHAPSTAQSSTGNSGSADPPDLSQFESSPSGNSGASDSSSGGSASSSSKGTHTHAKPKGPHARPDARKPKVTTARVTVTKPSRTTARTRTPRHS
jgi:cytoskeletal protein RodZ